MADNENDSSAIDPVAAIKAEMLALARKTEDQFPGANITIIISEPGCAASDDPAFNYATTADAADVMAVLRKLLAENQN